VSGSEVELGFFLIFRVPRETELASSLEGSGPGSASISVWGGSSELQKVLECS
jgi:hypothetical protein